MLILGGKPALVGKAPSGGDLTDGGRPGVRDQEVAVGAAKPDLPQVLSGACVQGSLERLLQSAHADAGCDGDIADGDWLVGVVIDECSGCAERGGAGSRYR